MILLEPYVNYVVDHQLTQQQLLFLLFIYNYQRVHQKRTTALLTKYQKWLGNGKTILAEWEKKDLFDRGFLELADGNIQNHAITNYQLTDKVIDIFVTEDDCAQEFWALYPYTADNGQGNYFVLKGMDYYHFVQEYNKAIMNSRAEHKEVMLDLKYAIENSLIKQKIETFTKGRIWLDMRQKRLQQLTTNKQTYGSSNY